MFVAGPIRRIQRELFAFRRERGLIFLKDGGITCVGQSRVRS